MEGVTIDGNNILTVYDTIKGRSRLLPQQSKALFT
jgi:hypothetical protein